MSSPTPLRDGAPLLTDIPGQLRQMADMIEAGEVSAELAYFVVPQEDDWPEIYGWGAIPENAASIGHLTLAAQFFVANITERHS